MGQLEALPAIADAAARLAAGQGRVVVVGVGHVGAPIATALARNGFSVTAVEHDAARRHRLREDDGLLRALATGRLTIAPSHEAIADADAVIVCVQTPIDAQGSPDLGALEAVATCVVAHARQGALVAVASTTPPGTTRRLFALCFEAAGRVVGRDVFLAATPERLDPARTVASMEESPRVVGGITEACTDLGAALFSTIAPSIVRVSSPEVAEASKLLENTFRAVNVALAFEAAEAFAALGLDPWEVLAAASTKPFGFMPFHPGPGAGGHCIPVDIHLLATSARAAGVETRLLSATCEVLDRRPERVVAAIASELHHLEARPGAVLIVGAAFKADVADARHSPSAVIAAALVARGVRVDVYDPWVDPPHLEGATHLRAVPFAASYDVAVIVSDHASLDFEALSRCARAIVDPRNALRRRGLSVPRLVVSF